MLHSLYIPGYIELIQPCPESLYLPCGLPWGKIYSTRIPSPRKFTMMPPISPRPLFRVLLLAIGFSLGLALAVFRPIPTLAQADPADLFYRFNGEPVPLVVQNTAIAVAFQDRPPSRSASLTPLYQQLQNDLNAAPSRGGDVVTVQPVGTRYAIATLPAGSRSGLGALRPRLQLPYVETTLAVVNRADQDEQILLPNEIIVSFAANTTEAEQQQILAAQGLALIRPLRFTENRILARVSNLDHETAVLTAAEQLNQTAGVRSATPNFIPVRSPGEPMGSELSASVAGSRSRSAADNLAALAWHLDSTSIAPGRSNTGVKAPAAWALGSRGNGITVAVLDTFTQWDHPELVNNTYELSPGTAGLPGESRGWDFVENDPDTRIEATELSLLRPLFQSAFTLSDTELLRQHDTTARRIKRDNPRRSDRQIAEQIRAEIRSAIAGGEFHGTTVAGVIGASTAQGMGSTGVAPAVKILPARTGTISSGPLVDASIEAIGYAAARGADVINLSWRMPPTTEVSDAIQEVLSANPRLVVVASSGNNGRREIGLNFPSSLPNVVSVGATTLQGTRAPYSSFGPGLTLVAPGGDMQSGLEGGILTTSGTGNDQFWQGIAIPDQPWSPAQDPRGHYVWTQGTSFASPAVAGVVALMLSADPERRLNRDRIIALLEAASSHSPLSLAPDEQELYRVLRDQSATPPAENELQYFFGSGLVDAEEAVRLVRASVR